MKKLILIILSGYCYMEAEGQKILSTPLDSSVKDNVVYTLCTLLANNYVFPEKANAMCARLRRQNVIHSYDTLTDSETFAAKLKVDIDAVYHDPHLRIEYNPQLEQDILRFGSFPKGKLPRIAPDLAENRKRNFYFQKVEILPSNIGYMNFTGFAGPSSDSRNTIFAAMLFLRNTDALIIDLRNNFGGNPNAVAEIASYFFSERTFIGRFYDRTRDTWTDEYIENTKTVNKRLVLTMPLYILTSKRTFSAAEGLAYTLQTMKNATIIGDTTKGGAHPTRSFSLGNGFVCFIPFGRGENYVTKTDWEGIGVIPAVVVPEKNSMTIAQNIILSKKLVTVTDSIEKRKLTYSMRYNLAQNADVKINQEKQTSFIGRYAEFEVSVQESQLMFRDVNQAGVIYKKMIPITPQLFQVGKDYQVEFVIENGRCARIQMYWDDGYEDSIPKSID